MAVLTLARYKIYKSISSSTEDTQYSAIIDAVNAFIEQYCGRTFTGSYGSDKTEYFKATDTELYPTEYPIVSVTSLEYSTDAGENYGNALAEYTDYIIDVDNDVIISLKGEFSSTTYPQNAIRLVYKGGYAAIPKDLELTAVHLAEFYAEEGYTPRKSLAGASIDNVIQPDMTARLPAHIRRVLDSYRIIVF